MDEKKYLEEIERVIARGPYSASWESLQTVPTAKWYQSAKFGIFIHWGPYSAAAYNNEWYSRNMYIKDSDEYKHHIATYGAHKNFGYKDFIPMLTAEKFNADEWAELFKESGAGYVVPVAEHHEGFQMYRSEISHWNAYEMGPKRDTLGELKAAIEKRGLTLGASSHRIEHWWFMGHGRDFDSDIKEPMKRGDFYWPAHEEPENQFDSYAPNGPDEEFMTDWLLRTCEIVDKYRPSLVYFDWWIHHINARKYIKMFAAYYYNRAAEWGIEAAINYKHDSFAFGSAVPTVERGQFDEVKPYLWQTDTCCCLNSWCYTDNNQYKDSSDIVKDLVDINAKNGCMLLNIGPKADGTICENDARILREIGAWMKVNGESIRGTRVWRVSCEGPTRIKQGQFTDGIKKEFTPRDIRYSTGNGAIYASVMKAPDDGVARICALKLTDDKCKPDFSGEIDSVELLGYNGSLEWKQDGEALTVVTAPVKTDMPLVYKVKVK
ncbi:MAG: alpha-L-fucosidase [Eubacteriales bacterium]|nr:alpha-L-fucosidase [Eubacteriales bacterium]MDD3881171.1 alpha-L-fucosidase [Eubacteriales bacterium]MDD4511553.1 alpha-L-fucosidase [Eubacteriales bacterium]